MIKFGTNQLQFAPFQELNSFIYWILLYMNYSLLAFILLMASIITSIVYKNAIYFTFSCMIGYNVFIFIIEVLFFCQCNIIWLLSQLYKTILSWRVMRYALTHKQPVRCRAFTYGEIQIIHT